MKNWLLGFSLLLILSCIAGYHILNGFNRNIPRQTILISQSATVLEIVMPGDADKILIYRSSDLFKKIIGELNGKPFELAKTACTNSPIAELRVLQGDGQLIETIQIYPVSVMIGNKKVKISGFDFYEPIDQFITKKIFFYDNGGQKADGVYEDKLRTGEWRFYYPDGGLEWIGNYKKGQKIGEWKRFNNKGVLMEVKNFSVSTN